MNGAGLLEFAPNGDALGLVGGGEPEKKEKPGQFFLYPHLCIYLYSIVIDITR